MNTEETTLEDTTNTEENIEANSNTEETTNVKENTETNSNIEETTNVEENTETNANTEETTNVEENTETQANEAGEITETTTEVQSIENTGMSMPFIGLSILQCIVALLLIIVVLQQSKTASPVISGGATTDTNSYWNKNKGRSREGKLSRLTIILGVIFFIITLVLGFIK